MPALTCGYRDKMLVRPVRYVADDATSAEEFLRARWAGLRNVELGPDFCIEVSGVQAEGFRVERLSHTSSLRIDATGPGPVRVVELLAGSASLECEGRVTELHPGDVLAVDAETGALTTTRAATLGLVTLTRELLAETAQVPPQRLRFPQQAPVTRDWAEHWRSAVRRSNRELSAHLQDGRRDPQSVGRQLAVAALASFDHEISPVEGHSGGLGGPDGLSGPDGPDGPVTRALAYIDAHATDPLTVSDIANAARTSVRALQLGFARHHQTSPTAYLRRVRLEGAHRDLTSAEPDGELTVAQVAARWGFTQPGRFAAHYRAAFGMLPSEALRTRPRT